MANLIHFFELPADFCNSTGLTLDGAAHKLGAFAQTGKAFREQFSETAMLPMFTAPAALQLRACALDAGHGWQRLAAKSPEDAVAFYRYCLRQLDTLLEALPEKGVAPVLSLQRAGFIDLLDKSEKITLGYQLGALACRLATGAWVIRRGERLESFWHFSVTTDPAACLITTPALNLPGAENPDYFFRTDKGWYSAEAKGSWDGQKWSELEDGLMQAAKYPDLHLFTPSLPGPPERAEVRAFTCARADFVKSELRITHVDPEPVAGLDRPLLLVVAEFASLVPFERAFAQFEAIGEALPAPAGPRAQEGGDPTPLRWRLWQRGETAEQCIYLGMSEPMSALRGAVALALAVLRTLVPLCAVDPGDAALARLELPIDADALLSALHRMPAGGAELPVALIEAIEALPPDECSPAAVVRRIASANWLPGETSVLDLVQKLDTIVRGLARLIPLEAGLGQAAGLNAPLPVVVTDCGLLVTSGAWREAPPNPERRRVPKI